MQQLAVLVVPAGRPQSLHAGEVATVAAAPARLAHRLVGVVRVLRVVLRTWGYNSQPAGRLSASLPVSQAPAQRAYVPNVYTSTHTRETCNASRTVHVKHYTRSVFARSAGVGVKPAADGKPMRYTACPAELTTFPQQHADALPCTPPIHKATFP